MLRLLVGAAIVCLSVTSGIPLSPGDPLNLTLNALEDVSPTFEYGVTKGLQRVRQTYPRIRLWAVEATSPRGPGVRPTDFTALKLWVHSVAQGTLAMVENGQDTESGWSDPVVIHDEARYTIRTFSYGAYAVEPMSTAFAARQTFVQAPVTRVVLCNFAGKPTWATKDQAFYGFYLDDDIEHAWWVGAFDLLVYGPQHIDAERFPFGPPIAADPVRETYFETSNHTSSAVFS